MRKVTDAIFALLAVGLSATAHAANRSAVLPFFGHGLTIEQCEQALTPVGRRFAAAAAVQLLGVGCRHNDILRNGSIDGVIRYASELPVQTSTSDLTSSVEFDGHYRTMQECRDALAREELVYIRHTGLTPFVSYCYRVGLGGGFRFRSRLDAVGEALTPKWSMTASWSFALARPAAAIEGIKRLGSIRGLDVFEASIDRDYTGWRMTVDYYADKGVQLLMHSGLRWPTVQECEAKGAQLLGNWSGSAPRVFFACDQLMDRSSSGLVILWISNSHLAEFDINAEPQSTTYASQAACEQDRARVEAHVRQTGYAVFGSICGQIDRRPQVRMVVFSEPAGE